MYVETIHNFLLQLAVQFVIRHVNSKESVLVCLRPSQSLVATSLDSFHLTVNCILLNYLWSLPNDE